MWGEVGERATRERRRRWVPLSFFKLLVPLSRWKSVERHGERREAAREREGKEDVT